jgi:hypothetical protein
LADLAVVGLSSYLHEKLEGQEFTDVNQVMQHAMAQENLARDNRSSSQFRDNGKEKERSNVCLAEEDLASDKDMEICMAEWVETPSCKPMTCTFLKPEIGKKDDLKFMFDVNKCDKLFDASLQNRIIRLKGGLVIPSAELVWKKYCKWQDSFSHTTNECNYFYRQIQLGLNDDRLTLGENQWIKVGMDPFPINMINFDEKRVLVQTDQANTTRGKNVMVSDELKVTMMNARAAEVDVWKQNVPRKTYPRWKPTSTFLMEKYAR